ncbi:MAG: C4-type zinc ribbon domain-containing protein [Eubacteriales bacterium]|nr:C4-type zinc ribbon domain-containing protein [Eubacteriales bacterium]
MQLDNLLKYSQIDMEAERFKSEMQKAPNRLKLLKLRNFIVEQQNNMKRIEAEVASMTERMGALREEIARLDGTLAELQKEISEAHDDSIAELEGLIDEAQKLMSTLGKHEQELQKMRKDAETRDRQQKDIRTRAAKSKAEYDQLKAVYDPEYKRDSEKLEQLKAKVEAAAKDVEPELLAKYKEIRQQSMPPVAKLVGSQCMGCNMSLPSAITRRITEGHELVQCDNCSRILYIPAEG